MWSPHLQCQLYCVAQVRYRAHSLKCSSLWGTRPAFPLPRPKGRLPACHRCQGGRSYGISLSLINRIKNIGIFWVHDETSFNKHRKFPNYFNWSLTIENKRYTFDAQIYVIWIKKLQLSSVPLNSLYSDHFMWNSYWYVRNICLFINLCILYVYLSFLYFSYLGEILLSNLIFGMHILFDYVISNNFLTTCYWIHIRHFCMWVSSCIVVDILYFDGMWKLYLPLKSIYISHFPCCK